MSLDPWNDIDDIKFDFNNVYCAFIDILGYKEKAKSFFGGSFNLHGRIERAFGHLNSSLSIAALGFDLSALDIRVVSDSIVLINPEQNGLATILEVSKQVCAYLSYEDLFVRGGISFGKHHDKQTEQSIPILASEALINAYLLESKVAINPRVVIDPSVVSHITNDERSFVIFEKKECILHYAPNIINEVGGNQLAVMSEMLEIQTAMNDSEDDGVSSKYQWVLDYYYWTLSNCSNVNIAEFDDFKSGEDRGFCYM